MAIKPIKRRHFLGGAGTALALPLLEAMLPVGKTAFAQGANPTRMLFYFLPNGIHMPSWTPNGDGNNYQISRTLEPLAPFRNDFSVLTDLNNEIARKNVGGHAPGTGAFLTGTSIADTNAPVGNGISVDQLAAQQLGRDTRFPSLVLGIDGGGSSGTCDTGYSCVYERNISWSGPTSPTGKTTSVSQLFNRMFGGFDAEETAKQKALRLKMNAGILDYVRADVAKLNQQLGYSDKARLDEYLTSINELEKKIVPMEDDMACAQMDAPGNNIGREEKIRLMTDLMTIAFQCDLTRYQSFMIANGFSFNIYPFLGFDDRHHDLTHLLEDPARGADATAKVEVINRWMVSQFSYLIEKFKNTTAVDGSNLLDSSMIFLSSEISHGNRHNYVNMPVILAGRGNGHLNPGRHIRYAPNQHTFGDLYLTMLQKAGLSINSFGQSGRNPIGNL